MKLQENMRDKLKSIGECVIPINFLSQSTLCVYQNKKAQLILQVCDWKGKPKLRRCLSHFINIMSGHWSEFWNLLEPHVFMLLFTAPLVEICRKSPVEILTTPTDLQVIDENGSRARWWFFFCKNRIGLEWNFVKKFESELD